MSPPNRPCKAAAPIAAALIAAASIGGTWWWHASQKPAGTPPAPSAARAAPGAFIGNVAATEAPAVPAAPELADTQAPDGLRVDAHGHLIVEAANRQVFDYFLDVPASLPEAQRVAMAEMHLRAKLAEPALGEAQALLQRYLDYRHALAAQGVGNAKPTDAQLQANPNLLDGLRAQFDTRSALRRQYLGAATAQAWYGDEDAADAAALQRMAVMTDASLSAEARAAKLAAIEATLPPAMQQARREAMAPARLANDMQQWRQQNLSEAQIRQRLATQGVDAAVADRLIQADRTEAGWRGRYDAYTRERDRIAAFPGLSEEDRAAQIDQLRSQTFPAAAEALRARALDTLPR